VFGVVPLSLRFAPYAGKDLCCRTATGYLHTYMVYSICEKLGLKVEDVNARLAAGETMYDIAIADGVKAEDFPALMVDVAQSMDAAVKDGVITQARLIG